MRAAGFFVFASIATLLPVAVIGWNMGAMAPFWFLAGDAYLYLGIGEASSGIAMSFDGLRPTNGFHPLWQTWVRAATALSGDPLGAMTWVAYSAIALTWAGVLTLGAAIRRFTGSWFLAMLAVPGVYYLMIGQSLQNLPVWGFFDGMEVGLAFFLAALLAFVIAGMTRDPDAGPWPLIGLILGLLVLTRLDEVFVPASIALAVLAWPGRPLAARIVAGAWITAPTAIGLALFVGWSLATTGMMAPVSGAAKGEGALIANAWVSLATIFSPLIDLREALSAYQAERGALLGGAFRVVQLVVPALFALGFMGFILARRFTAPWAPVLTGIGGGILAKATYNLLLVNYWHQASWYFAVAMMMMTLGTAIMLAPAVKRQGRWGRAIAAGTLGALSILHASLWSAALMTDTLRPAQRDFWLDRGALQATLLEQDPALRVMEFGDGMINFSFDFPVRHGFVFAGDAQSLESLRAGRLLRESYADGFRVLSSYEYLRVPDGAEDWDSDRIRAFLENSFLDDRIKDELRYFDFEMRLVHRPSGVPFIGLIPRG